MKHVLVEAFTWPWFALLFFGFVQGWLCCLLVMYSAARKLLARHQRETCGAE